MEFDLKDNTLFLEFYGLPGCGKSTISHLLAEELRRQGKIVMEPTYVIDHRYSPILRKGIKLLKLFRYVLFNSRKYKTLSNLIRVNGFSGTEALSQVVNIALKLWGYDHAKADYVIFDEGLTQSAISLAKNESSCLETERKLYELCKQRTVRKLFIKVSPEIALSRLVGRDRHDSRIEKISDKVEKVKAMKNLEKQCNTIIPGFVIEDASIEFAVNCIIRQIG